MVFDLLKCPTECSTHSLKLNRSERLEIKHDSTVPDKVRQVMYVWREMNVYEMSCLKKKNSRDGEDKWHKETY
jgi:hypothetical protein